MPSSSLDSLTHPVVWTPHGILGIGHLVLRPSDGCRDHQGACIDRNWDTCIAPKLPSLTSTAPVWPTDSPAPPGPAVAPGFPSLARSSPHSLSEVSWPALLPRRLHLPAGLPAVQLFRAIAQPIISFCLAHHAASPLHQPLVDIPYPSFSAGAKHPFFANGADNPYFLHFPKQRLM